jgi:DNA (cytosine-5)-methyltransferase 1
MKPPPTFGSLFSGIGGFDLGLERAGWRCAWQIEVDPYRQAVLQRHWPDVPRYGDIRDVDPAELPPVDLLCGGFPCEDISRANGTGAAKRHLDGAKSGLWAEYARLVRHLRPGYVLVENSTSLLVRGLDRVLGDLAACGYDAEWDCLPAAAFGAPHIRDRLYLLAYPGERRRGAPDATVFAGWAQSQLHGGWAREPQVRRVADGVPRQVERLRALGDAVVPPASEWLGRRIVEHAGLPAPPPCNQE